jgi:hypothetical protein
MHTKPTGTSTRIKTYSRSPLPQAAANTVQVVGGEMRTGLIVRDDVGGEPMSWASWSEWRQGRRDPWSVWVRTTPRPCPTCWGQRRILEPGPLGLLPVICEACSGRGTIGVR